MSFIAAAVTAAAAIGSTLIGKRASDKAARAQTQAAEQSNQLQREQFDRQIELQEPFRQAGMTGQNELMRLLGYRAMQDQRATDRQPSRSAWNSFRRIPDMGSACPKDSRHWTAVLRLAAAYCRARR